MLNKRRVTVANRLNLLLQTLQIGVNNFSIIAGSVPKWPLSFTFKSTRERAGI
jgi:hypothetical protein